MPRRRTAILLALGLLAPLTLASAPAGALDQDLVASVTAGPPGTVITVSSATCVPQGTDGEAGLDVSLYVGTAPNVQIVANGFSDTGSTTLTIPDWVDPDQPAVIKGSCYLYSEQGGDDDIDYDPIDFDIEPGSGTPVQVRTFSRTELLAGQGLGISGSCGPDEGDGFVSAIVTSGTDQSGSFEGEFAGSGGGRTASDGSFDIDLILSNASIWFEYSSTNGGPVQFDLSEEPMNLPPGEYTTYVYCTNDGESIQFLEPQTLTITGAAPTDGIDLTNVAGSREVTLAGECAAGDVVGGFEAIPMSELIGEADGPAGGLKRRGILAEAPTGPTRQVAGRPVADGMIRTSRGSVRALVDEGTSEFTATTGTDGSWQASDTVGFDEGAVVAMATCGDPLADGYAYDPQGLVTSPPAPPVTVPTTVPVPVPAPANAVPGTPTYAG